MNIFSGRSNSCRFLAKYDPLTVLPCWYMGLFCGLRGPKIGQNDQIFDFWVHFLHFHATRLRDKYFFW